MPCKRQVVSRLWRTPTCSAPTSVQQNSQLFRLCQRWHKRNNWLFSDTVHGAKASANLYSLIETAKANGLDPYAYLRRVFTELPNAQTVEDVEKLLPRNLNSTATNNEST
jgi:IS66 C-terminal element